MNLNNLKPIKIDSKLSRSRLSGVLLLTSKSKVRFWLFVKTSVWLLGLTSSESYASLLELASRIWILVTKSGCSFTVSYLKEAVRLVSKTLAGEEVSSLEEPRVAVRRGLPLIIPGSLRLQMESRNPKIIKAVLTILSVYRVMKARPKLKLGTITSPHTGMVKTLPELTLISQWMKPFLGKKSIAEITPYTVGRNLKLLTTSGPNSRLQLVAYPIDAIALRDANLLDTFRSLAMKLNAIDLWHKLEKELSTPLKGLMPQWRVDDTLRTSVGRLALKLEPAGKVRVFAMVDAWTQSLLDLIHRDLFSVLSRISSDGTFDQHRAVKRMLDDDKLQSFWSFDLSAATDRLPIDLQEDLLNAIYGNSIGTDWRNLLLNRDYILDSKDPEFESSNGAYRYAVGQPMGALSSWALLAISHHAIVQIAALRVGFKSWFEDYAVLGDDIVIANENVAKAYLVIMEQLGVEINLSKSVVSSSNSCEFAKKLYINGIDMSPLGPKAILQCLSSPRDLKDVILNYNLIDQVEFTSLYDQFKQLLIEGQKFSSQKWLRRVVPLYWDIVGLFGLNLNQDLSPFLREQAISSLDSDSYKSFKESFESLIDYKVTGGWLQALESDVNMYNRYSRYLSIDCPISHFPSTQDILAGLSSQMMETSSHFNIPSGQELAIAFSSQARLSWVIESDLEINSRASKPLLLSKELLRDLWEKNPKIAIAIVRDSQADRKSVV